MAGDESGLLAFLAGANRQIHAQHVSELRPFFIAESVGRAGVNGRLRIGFGGQFAHCVAVCVGEYGVGGAGGHNGRGRFFGWRKSKRRIISGIKLKCPPWSRL